MRKMQSRLFNSFVLVIMLAFLTGIAYSQSDSTKNHKMYSKKESTKYSTNVMRAAQSLKSKVELTATQTKDIEGILQEYKDNSMKSSTAGSSDDVLTKIENVLTAKQKPKFDEAKTKWWDTTKKGLSQMSTTKNPKSNY